MCCMRKLYVLDDGGESDFVHKGVLFEKTAEEKLGRRLDRPSGKFVGLAAQYYTITFTP